MLPSISHGAERDHASPSRTFTVSLSAQAMQRDRGMVKTSYHGPATFASFCLVTLSCCPAGSKSGAKIVFICKKSAA